MEALGRVRGAGRGGRGAGRPPTAAPPRERGAPSQGPREAGAPRAAGRRAHQDAPQTWLGKQQPVAAEGKQHLPLPELQDVPAGHDAPAAQLVVDPGPEKARPRAPPGAAIVIGAAAGRPEPAATSAFVVALRGAGGLGLGAGFGAARPGAGFGAAWPGAGFGCGAAPRGRGAGLAPFFFAAAGAGDAAGFGLGCRCSSVIEGATRSTRFSTSCALFDAAAVVSSAQSASSAAASAMSSAGLRCLAPSRCLRC